jgi:hypothetical protein
MFGVDPFWVIVAALLVMPIVVAWIGAVILLSWLE